MVSGILCLQGEIIQGIEEELTARLNDPPDDPQHAQNLQDQEPGDNHMDLVMFLQGKGPPGPYDDIIDGSVDASLNGQWSQL